MPWLILQQLHVPPTLVGGGGGTGAFDRGSYVGEALLGSFVGEGVLTGAADIGVGVSFMHGLSP